MILDYAAADKINLKGLISLAEENGNANNVLDVVDNGGGIFSVSLKNENTVLQNGNGGAGLIMTVTSGSNIVFSFNDHDWTYNISTHTLA